MHFKEAYDPFRAAQSGWAILKKAPAAILVGGLLLWICENGGTAGFNLTDQNFHFDIDELDQPDVLRDRAVAFAQALLAGLGALVMCLSCVIALAAWVFSCLVRIGFAVATERALVTGEDQIGDLFSARGRLGSMLIVTLLSAIIFCLATVPGIALGGLTGVVTFAAGGEEDWAVAAGIGVFLLYLPVLVYVVLGISLSTRAVAIEGMGPTEAISRSWFLVRGNRWTLFLYYFVFFVVFRLCGCLDCCLLFFPTSLLEAAQNDSYLRMVRSGEPHEWSSAPKPTAS